MKKLLLNNIFFFLFLSLSIFLFQACVKEKIDLTKAGNNSGGPQFAGALVYSSLTLADIMKKTDKNGQLVTDSTGFITLVYKGNLFSLKAADVVTIPPQSPAVADYTLTATNASAINVAPVGGTISLKDSSLINFDAGGTTQIDKLNSKTATLTIDLAYGIKHNALIKITIPSATLGGIPFTQTIPVTYSGSIPINVTQNYSLNGYTIDMTNGGTTHNVIKIKYGIIITKSANTTNAGDAISFTETFSNVTYNSIVGYLGQQFLSPNTDTVAVTIFQNNLFGSGATFHLLNPLIKVFLTNSYGLPISAHFNTFEGYSPGQATVPITGAPNPLFIPTPLIIGQSAEDSFKLDNSNSNINTLINNFPKNIIYNVISQSNPAGAIYTNFITDTSQFNVDMELDLPLYGTVTNFMFQDTVKYSFDLSTTNIESITVRGYFSNGFPIDVGMSVTFVDSVYNVMDELINPPYQLVIPSASVGSTGMVTTPTQHTADFTIPNSLISKLSKVKYILIGAVVNSANHGTTNVKMYDFYNMDVKLGVNVKTFFKF